MDHDGRPDLAHACDVNGWHDVPSPRCGRCGATLLMALDFVRWTCPGCVRWGWVEPPKSAQVWQAPMVGVLAL